MLFGPVRTQSPWRRVAPRLALVQKVSPRRRTSTSPCSLEQVATIDASASSTRLGAATTGAGASGAGGGEAAGLPHAPPVAIVRPRTTDMVERDAPNSWYCTKARG